LHHRRTGRPFVVLKLAMTIDGFIAAKSGAGGWITGEIARRRVHELRAASDAIVVGAGTVRADDPRLTVRDIAGPSPRRIVLGRAPKDARVHPCTEWSGPLTDLLDTLGREDTLQLMVEGGANVAASFHQAGLVDRYVFHIAPVVMGGADAVPAFAGEYRSHARRCVAGRVRQHSTTWRRHRSNSATSKEYPMTSNTTAHGSVFAPIDDVIAAIARGEMVVIVDDEDRENEGDLIMAAQHVTAEKTGVHHSTYVRSRGGTTHRRAL